jgi:hypothetical protein
VPESHRHLVAAGPVSSAPASSSSGLPSYSSSSRIHAIRSGVGFSHFEPPEVFQERQGAFHLYQPPPAAVPTRSGSRLLSLLESPQSSSGPVTAPARLNQRVAFEERSRLAAWIHPPPPRPAEMVSWDAGEVVVAGGRGRGQSTSIPAIEADDPFRDFLNQREMGSSFDPDQPFLLSGLTLDEVLERQILHDIVPGGQEISSSGPQMSQEQQQTGEGEKDREAEEERV